jgi:hypothetical protein
MKSKALCPSCGAELVFRSRVSVCVVCSFCRTLSVRHDLDLEAHGKVALLQEDASLLQLGVRGNYKGDPFTLVGRLHLEWEDGYWDEWFADCHSGKPGWLGEAQGFYMMSFETPSKGFDPGPGGLLPGRTLQLQGKDYEVDDVKDVTCTVCEGELPFAPPLGRKYQSIDLTGPGRSFANLDSSGEGFKLYLGEYLDFDKFQFQGLRKMEGW